jgi:hypothetical protein
VKELDLVLNKFDLAAAVEVLESSKQDLVLSNGDGDIEHDTVGFAGFAACILNCNHAREQDGHVEGIRWMGIEEETRMRGEGRAELPDCLKYVHIY